MARLHSSLLAGLLGLVLVASAVALAYRHETISNEAALAETAHAMAANAPSGDRVGQFVAATGIIDTPQLIGDEFLAPGHYLKLLRSVEMYAWEEQWLEDETEDRSEVLPRYIKVWTASPADSRRFRLPADHLNPPLPLTARSLLVEQASVSGLRLDLTRLLLPRLEPLRISTLQTQGGEVFEDKLYLAKANPRQPEVGDLRIGYAAYAPGGTVTVYGELETMGSLTPHRRDGVGMYRLFAGTQEDALAQLTREHGPQLWSWRFLMGLLSWAGLWLCLPRLNGRLSQLPFPGGHGRVISGAQTLPIALVMTGALVLAARATHHLGVAVAVEALALLLACHFWGELPARAKRKLI